MLLVCCTLLSRSASMAHLSQAPVGSDVEETAIMTQEFGALRPPRVTATNRPLCWS